MYWNRHDMNGWDWFAMSISTALMWALLVTVAVLLFRTLNRSPELPHTPTAASPEQLLADRFARGEIDEDEYRNRLAVLRAEGPSLTKR
ncbi:MULTISPECIES: SHOCT domain-containing protein [unclassified Streptomyces]|uniref:SHOCT domain-containing protein n=1 Tax=unclassified Streptomyces TaxID=2593676 RepID=UPI0038699013|nr:SHOCT domain-containing protein [Streptomyces sp. NBC_00827]